MCILGTWPDSPPEWAIAAGRGDVHIVWSCMPLRKVTANSSKKFKSLFPIISAWVLATTQHLQGRMTPASGTTSTMLMWVFPFIQPPHTDLILSRWTPDCLRGRVRTMCMCSSTRELVLASPLPAKRSPPYLDNLLWRSVSSRDKPLASRTCQDQPIHHWTIPLNENSAFSFQSDLALPIKAVLIPPQHIGQEGPQLIPSWRAVRYHSVTMNIQPVCEFERPHKKIVFRIILLELGRESPL